MAVLTGISVGGLVIALAAYLYARLGGLIVNAQASPVPGQPGADTGAGTARRRAAKLFNERLKLTAAFLNTLGVGGFISIVIVPYVNADAKASLPPIGIGFVSLVVVHGVAQLVLSAWKSEE